MFGIESRQSERSNPIKQVRPESVRPLVLRQARRRLEVGAIILILVLDFLAFGWVFSSVKCLTRRREAAKELGRIVGSFR